MFKILPKVKIEATWVPVFACTPDKFPDLMAAALGKQDITVWAAKEDIVLKK